MSGLSSVINTIFGGSNSSSQSGNQAYPWVQSNFGTPGANAYGSTLSTVQGALGSSPQSVMNFINSSPGMSSYTSALNSMGSALGSSPQDFWNNGGGNFLLNQGLDGLTSRYSAMGLDHSGAAMKGMEDYRSGLASQFLQNYLGDLQGMGSLGLQGGQLANNAFQNWTNGALGLGDLGSKGGALTEAAGEYSKGSGSESSGKLGKSLGALLAFI